jgi:hypothetical protein
MLAIILFLAGAGFIGFAVVSSMTGEITGRDKSTFYRTSSTIHRADDPAGFKLLIVALWTFGLLSWLMGAAVGYLYR